MIHIFIRTNWVDGKFKALRVFELVEIQATGSSYGTHFRVSTFGESHGGGVGCIIDGCPPRIPLTESDLQFDLDRRYFDEEESSSYYII